MWPTSRNISLLGSLVESGPVVNLHVVGNQAYLANENQGVRVVNVSNPGSPYVTSGCVMVGGAESIQATGTDVWAGDTGLRCLDSE